MQNSNTMVIDLPHDKEIVAHFSINCSKRRLHSLTAQKHRQGLPGWIMVKRSLSARRICPVEVGLD